MTRTKKLLQAIMNQQDYKLADLEYALELVTDIQELMTEAGFASRNIDSAAKILAVAARQQGLL